MLFVIRLLLALCLLVTWSDSAWAAPSAAQLREAMLQASQSEEWAAADDAYHKLTLATNDLTVNDHEIGLGAALQVGNLAEAKTRAEAAQSSGHSTVAGDFLRDFSTDYGQVWLFASGASLIPANPPQLLVARNAVAYASKRLKQSGEFNGYLPRGTYSLDGWRVYVSPDAPMVTVDARSNPQPKCTRAVSKADWLGLLTQAEAQWANNETASFRGTTAKIRTDLSCVRERIAPKLAARVHRLQALLAFTNHDNTAARFYFSAAKSAHPGFKESKSNLAAKNPVLKLYQKAPLRNSEAHAPVPEPSQGHLALDGRESTSRSTETPMVVQWFDDNKQIRTTAYLPHYAPWPEYLSAGSVAVAAGPVAVAAGSVAVAAGGGVDKEPTRRCAPFGKLFAKYTHRGNYPDCKTGKILIGTGGALLASALGMGIGAMVVGGSADDATDRDQFDSRKNAANGLTGAAIGAGVVGAALLSVGLVYEF